MNYFKKSSKTRMTALITLLSVFMLTACGGSSDSSGSSARDAQSSSDAESESASKESSGVNENYVTPESGRKISLSEDGTLNIERPQRSGIDSGAEDGTWTIFVYLCGADLESEYGCATDNMAEMAKSSKINENIKFIVQTGGANEWQNDVVDGSKFQRYEISGGEYYLIDEQPIDDMGKKSSLSDFLSWGIQAYPAQHTGIVFWDHGGGSISGVCFDERYDDNSLSLGDIDDSLLSVYDLMGKNFDFVGFDACLMGTIETANILASYADYMYASQETEPGEGWDYSAMVTYLSEHPDADGAELGKVVADSFYDKNTAEDDTANVTMAVTDLSKIDDVNVLFNSYALDVFNSTEKADKLAEYIRNVIASDNFGGNNKAVGFTNLIDLEGLINAGTDYSDKTVQLNAALKEAVVYKRNGESHEEACGLSIYYPLQIQDGSAELKTFGSVAISPYYLAFVDRVAYGAANSGDISDYDSSEVINLWETSEATSGSSSADNFGSYWDYYDSYATTGESQLITFASEPQIDEQGNFSFVLTDEALQNTSDVQASLYEVSEDGQDIILLGNTTDITADYDTATFKDNFDGYWFSLSDGQNLSVYIMSQDDDSCQLSSPILLNGKETNLLYTWDYNTGHVTINGTWEGIDGNGMAARDTTELKAGDIIIPTYQAINLDTSEYTEYYGEEYTFADETELYYGLLPDGNYFYSFEIYDIYGDSYQTDFVNYTMEDGEPYYSVSATDQTAA